MRFVLLEKLAIDGKSAQLPVMNDIEKHQSEFFLALDNHQSGEALFDLIPDTVFFLKDIAGRYMSVNQTLVERCNRTSKSELIGYTAAEIFPEPLGESITRQDEAVLRSGTSLRAKLELHLYTGGREGWCLTWKEPLRTQDGDLLGLSGISRDIQTHTDLHSDIPQISDILTFIERNIEQPLRLPDLAKIGGLSGYQLDKRIRALFGISAGQYITRLRIEFACNQLKSSDSPISEIALNCGYGDQAAFSRQFRQSVGLTPATYRKKYLLQNDG